MKYHLAIDIGASSGRHILGYLDNGVMILQEIYRFDNGYRKRNGYCQWNLEELFLQIILGMKCCITAGKIPDTVGIDTWGLDYVLMDQSCEILGGAVAYRDERTQKMDQVVQDIIPDSELYSHTGTQKQIYNTIYQLVACKQKQPELLEKAWSLLMLPAYFHFRLTGKMANEYTSVSTTGLLNAQNKSWDMELIQRLGLPTKLFSVPIKQPSTRLGNLCHAVQNLVGFDCTVILPASHDTASAYMAIPARKNSVYLSSGTWSLLGVETLQPILSEESRCANFTNEGGYDGKYRYLKNIMGTWMLQSIRRELSPCPEYEEIMEMAKKEADFPSIVDLDDPHFMAPKSMLHAITEVCIKSGQPAPQNPGQALQCVYRSMARCYAHEIEQLQMVTKRRFEALHITGGGSQDAYLNTLTAIETGIPVYAGPIEGTALGNLIAQWIASGELQNLQQARDLIANQFAIQVYQP